MTQDVKAAREKRGWTQQELADRSGVNISTVSRIEAGIIVNPSNETVKRLEKAFKVQRGTLVFGQVMEAKAS